MILLMIGACLSFALACLVALGVIAGEHAGVFVPLGLLLWALAVTVGGVPLLRR